MKKIISMTLCILLMSGLFCIPTANAEGYSSGYREVLTQLIDQANTAHTGRAFVMTETQRSNLNTALAAASTVLDDEQASYDTLTETIDNLTAALDPILTKNMSLQQTHDIKVTLILISFVMTQEQITLVDSYIAELDALAKREDVTHVEYAALMDRFNNDMEDLFTMSFTKEQLGTLIINAEPYKDSAVYTADSYEKFTFRYDTAVTVYNSAAPVQKDIDSAFNGLLDAVKMLENKPENKYGDIDDDGNITIVDTLLLQKALAKFLELTPDQQKTGDVDGDKKISVYDVLLVQQYIAKIINQFPVEKATNPGDISDTPVDSTPFI